MTTASRERVKAALQFERPDSLPKNDSFWDQTLRRWRKEGMPRDAEPTNYFGFDIDMMYLDASPRYPTRILENKNGFITYEDAFGYMLRKEAGGQSTIEFLDHKNKSQETWTYEIKPRLVLSRDPLEPARLDIKSYFGHFGAYPSWEEVAGSYKHIRAKGRYQLFAVYGPWEAAWRHRGMEALLMDTVMEPDWFEEMAATHINLVIATLRRCLELGLKPDGLFLAEDLGCNTGPLFSPDIWDRAIKQHQERLGEFLRDNDIAFWMHSDGRIDLYLDRLIETGVQALNPLEVNAGMDIVDLRKRYGKNLAFYGNISRQNLAGSRDALGEELLRKIPLARDGGYILHSDHSVPPEVSFEQYSWMLKRAQDVFQSA